MKYCFDYSLDDHITHSKFNQPSIGYLIIIDSIFRFFNHIEFKKIIEIIKEATNVRIPRFYFDEKSLKHYLHWDVEKEERIFKSNGLPYEKYIKSGYYIVTNSCNPKVYITKAGAYHLYRILTIKRIIDDFK